MGVAVILQATSSKALPAWRPRSAERGYGKYKMQSQENELSRYCMRNIATFLITLSVAFLPVVVRSEDDRKDAINGDIEDISVKVRQPDGKVVLIPSKRLTDEDRARIVTWLTRAAEAPVKSPASKKDDISKFDKMTPEEVKVMLRRENHAGDPDKGFVVFKVGIVNDGLRPELFKLVAKHWPKLHSVTVVGGLITDSSLVGLDSFTELTALSIQAPIAADGKSGKITDRGLANLKGLTKLKHLSICSANVTNAGLVHLEDMKELEELNLSETKVTKVGIDKLYKSLPKCLANIR